MTGLKFYIGSSNGRHFEANIKSLVVDIANKNVVLSTECYEVDSAEPGRQKLISEVNASYGRNLIANNSTLVHPETGQYWESIEEKPEDIDPVGEWDFFWFIANNVEVKIAPFIIQTLSNNRERLMPNGFTLDVPEEESPTE